MGLLVFIYRNANGDSSNGGVSSGREQLTAVNIDGPFEPTPDRPAIWLVPGNLPGTLKFVTEDPSKATRRPMFGGTYIHTSDSRFARAAKEIAGIDHSGPVALHDRYE